MSDAEVNYRERKARCTVVFIADESGSEWVKGVNEYSEKHLHEGHEVEPLETLYDNPVEVTMWYRCHTCKVDYWHASTEIVEA